MAGRIDSELKLSRPITDRDTELFLNVVITADRLTRVEARVLKAHGLQRIQYNVLRILRGAGAPGLPCSAITDRMISREPDITRLLDRLERKGFIQRRRGTEDRRVVFSSITEAGLAAIRPLDGELREAISGMLAHLSSAEKSQLIDLLERCRDTG